jgi:CelD/BcsL family acetyltransferase involved in cellulose biosynthesis
MELIRPIALRSRRGSAREHGTRHESGLIERVGRLALLDEGEWLDRVHARSGASLLARRQWLESWAEAFPDWEPWVLAVVDQGDPRAVAPLARRRVGSGVQVVSVGHDALAESPLAVSDAGAAEELAAGIVSALRSLGRPWTLCLQQLPLGSPLAASLGAQLSTSKAFAGVPRPVLRFADDRPARRWLSRNTANALAKAQNRIRRDAHRLEVGWVQSWDEIERWLPDLVAVHRARDIELRGATLLDDIREASFYHRVITRHTGHWRLLAVRIDEALAGYALCLQDGRTLRVWDNRVAPGWRHYSAGLIANAELVLHAAADASIGEVDWGCGEQRYKLSLSNEVIDAQVLRGWSSPVLRAALAGRNRLDRRRTARTRSSPADS